MLKPTDSWTWYYDHKDDSLMLDLGEEMVFRVSIPTKHLVTSAYECTVFTVDDATIYQGFLENIAQLELSAPRKVELALNAVAASRFHKPMMPKSWFFETQQGGCEPENGDVVTLQTEFGTAKYLVIEIAAVRACVCWQTLSQLLSHQLKKWPFVPPLRS